MNARNGILATGMIAAIASGCSGISDCKEDATKCAEMLNGAAQDCAVAATLVQGDDKRKNCESAVKVVARTKTVAAVPGLTGILAVPETNLPDDNHRRDAAKALGQIGDPSAVDALLGGIDFTAGTSNEPRDKNANRTNEEIASALGKLRDKKAVPKLVELMGKSRENYVVLKAIRALGELGDAAAVPELSKVALGHDDKFMRKNAVIALGDIQDPSATDTLVQMMFIEYQGVSFYREASLALFQIGPSVAAALIDTMAGKNNAVNQYFEKTGGLKETAIKAKCGFVLGDLRDARAVEPLLEAFKAAVEKNDPVVLVYASAPLAVLGDARAVPALSAQMSTLDASLRDPIMRALNQLGDRSVVPAMIDTMKPTHFVEKCVKDGLASKEECAADKAALGGAQKAAADHVTNLGGPEHVDALRAVVDAEQDAAMKKYFEDRMKRVDAAVECKADATCWTKKLEDTNPLVREKAAWELGRLKDPATLEALTKALSDKKPEVRSAAIMAYWTYGTKDAVAKIEAQLADEAGAADFIRVNEDLKRLLIYLKRKA